MLSFINKKPTRVNKLAEFMRNGSAEEHKRVFKKVIEESIKDQQAVLDKAKQMKSAGEKKNGNTTNFP